MNISLSIQSKGSAVSFNEHDHFLSLSSYGMLKKKSMDYFFTPIYMA